MVLEDSNLFNFAWGYEHWDEKSEDITLTISLGCLCGQDLNLEWRGPKAWQESKVSVVWPPCDLSTHFSCWLLASLWWFLNYFRHTVALEPLLWLFLHLPQNPLSLPIHVILLKSLLSVKPPSRWAGVFEGPGPRVRQVRHPAQEENSQGGEEKRKQLINQDE